MIKLEVIGVTARPKSDEQRQRRLSEQAQALAEQHAEQPEPWVRLKERTGDRVLELMIGPAGAAAIAWSLQGVRHLRPVTHDFLGNLLWALDDVSVLGVIITKREFPVELARQLADGEAVLLGGTETFCAQLELRKGERIINLDCRPSNGIAVAVRLGVPIVAADELEPVLATA